jgi:hypothetical protein
MGDSILIQQISKRLAEKRPGRKAQRETPSFGGRGKEDSKPKGDPTAKLLDGIYDDLCSDETEEALAKVHKLTKVLGLEEEVSFEVEDTNEEENLDPDQDESVREVSKKPAAHAPRAPREQGEEEADDHFPESSRREQPGESVMD